MSKLESRICDYYCQMLWIETLPSYIHNVMAGTTINMAVWPQPKTTAEAFAFEIRRIFRSEMGLHPKNRGMIWAGACGGIPDDALYIIVHIFGTRRARENLWPIKWLKMRRKIRDVDERILMSRIRCPQRLEVHDKILLLRTYYMCSIPFPVNRVPQKTLSET